MKKLLDPKKRRWLCIPIFLAAVLSAGALAAFGAGHFKRMEAVMWVNNTPVTAEELLLAVQACRSEVISYYYTTYGITDSPEFWVTEVDGQTPRRRLLETAVRRAARYKAEQLMMQDAGIVSDISWAAFQKEFLAENERRLEAVQKGEVVYGPKQYTEYDYFNYLHNNRLLKLKAALNGGTDYSDGKFLEAYAEFEKTMTMEIDWDCIDSLPVN